MFGMVPFFAAELPVLADTATEAIVRAPLKVLFDRGEAESGEMIGKITIFEIFGRDLWGTTHILHTACSSRGKSEKAREIQKEVANKASGNLSKNGESGTFDSQTTLGVSRFG